MTISPISLDNVAEYVRYCRLHGAEHDESFLPDDAFVPTEEYPAYLLLQGAQAVGAVGLMRTQPYRTKGKARLTIFHAADPSPAAYAALLAAIRPHTSDLHSVYGFLPQGKTQARRCWEALGFVVERTAYLLAYHARTVPPASVPEGYSLIALEPADTVGIREMCDLWNENYGQQPGFVGASPEYLTDVANSDEYIPGGILLLRRGHTPVGTALVCRDDVNESSANIGMLSVHPGYRGQGLGRLMLRTAVDVALRDGMSPVYLSVDAHNASALALYLSEGFIEDAVMVCYALTVG
ncbi:MAG: GNAT family N-acetyltransferase [Anaerolineae bacterium]|nr:GNAT family N-acetyltransferase [Anaerolineae bacterium]